MYISTMFVLVPITLAQHRQNAFTQNRVYFIFFSYHLRVKSSITKITGNNIFDGTAYRFV